MSDSAREAIALAAGISQRIWQAQHLRKVCRDWKHDATWRELRVALELDYGMLLDLDTNSAAWQRMQIEGLLEIEPPK